MSQAKAQESSRSFILFKNSSYNFLSQGLIIILSLWAIPILVHGMGNEKFGLLALLWSIVGYFSLLDFGISRATTKFLSEAIAHQDKKLSLKIIWISLLIVSLAGLVSLFVFIGITPYLLLYLFKVSPSLYAEANSAFVYSALSIPFMLVFGIVKGIQMAYERFDLVNVYQGLSGIIQWIGSVILIWLGYGLKEVMMLTLFSRIFITMISFYPLPKIVDGFIYHNIHWDRQVIRRLFYFGGWLTIVQILNPLLVYFDRVLIGHYLNLSAVTYYSIPQEVMIRVLVIPASIATVLFPVFSKESSIVDGQEKYSSLYYKSMNYLLFIMLPIILVLIVFAHDILSFWVGQQYGQECTLVFQIVSCGILFASLGQIPTTLLQALGRPDLCAKFFALELPLMIILNVIIIPLLGIVGAAMTWSIRLAFDFGLLIFAGNRLIKKDAVNKYYRLFWKQTIQFIILIIMVFGVSSVYSFLVKCILTSLIIIIHFTWSWVWGFDDLDRQSVLNLKRKIFA